MAEVKEAVSSRALEVLDVTGDTLQGSEGAATPAVTSAAGLGLGPAVGQMGACGAEAVLGTAGDSLSIGNGQLGKERVAVEVGIVGLGMVSPIPHPTALEWG